MQSTDRPQVRDIIEQLQRFDPRARVTSSDFEIIGFHKSDDYLVYLETDQGFLLEKNKALQSSVRELEQRWSAVASLAETEPEKLAKFILEWE